MRFAEQAKRDKLAGKVTQSLATKIRQLYGRSEGKFAARFSHRVYPFKRTEASYFLSFSLHLCILQIVDKRY